MRGLTLYYARFALGAAFLCGISMALSFGIKSPLDYSVFSASACALLLARCEERAKERIP